jgi:glycosyltransferase involved in cell wall biosynthesis
MGTPAPQRILYVDSAPFTGGAQESLLTLLAGVAGRGWEPVLVSADRSEHGLLERCRQRGWRVHAVRTSHWRATPVGAVRLGVERLAAGRVIRRAIAEAAPVLIHANGVRSGLLLPADAWRAAPVLLHDRDLRVPRPALGWLARRVRAVLAISECVAAKWRSRLPAERLQVVPNGFDLESLAATTPVAGLAAPGVSVWVALVADLEPWKRHDVFLQAVAACVAAGAELGAVVVGRARTPAASRYLRRLQGLAEALGIAARVRFVTTAAAGVPWLAAADIVVSAALAEPFGRTVIEALALGRPVVAVNACGPAEILAGCPAATLTDATPAALAAGIRGWLAAERRAAAVAPARAWAARYGQAAMLDRVCAVYQAVLSAGA